MSCPKCGCKVTYNYDCTYEGMGMDEGLERCSACGYIFYDYIEGVDDDDY